MRRSRGQRWWPGLLFALLTVASCAPRPLIPIAPATTTDPLERCHEAYLTAGSDGPKLLAVDSMIVDSATSPPLRCGPLRSAHPRLKSSE